MKTIWKLLLLLAVVVASAAVAGTVGGAAGTSLARRALDIEPAALPGDRFAVQSEVLGETIDLAVRLPVGYAAEPEQRYPVLWTTDGRSHLDHAAVTVETLHRLGLGPQAIVVAVPSTSGGRSSDFLPPEAGWAQWDGRSDRFLAFLLEDARPAVESAFRTTDEHLLFGHSFGGVFVSWAWMERPDAFSGWFASSPSWWTADGALLDMIEQALESGEPRPWLDATLGSEEGFGMDGPFERARLMFEAADPEGTWHRFERTDAADHGSNPELALPRALAAYWRSRAGSD